MVPTEHAEGFAEALTGWFRKVGEDYPWRRTRDPYAILVSEVMLQQTQVATVLGKGYFTRWMERFPDVGVLAEASEDEVVKAWEGLGYYRRARNLLKAARAVVELHGGIFPVGTAEILALPGVGRYTAGAVASFAFGRKEALVDANVARVFSRLFDFRERVDSTGGLKKLWGWADELVAVTEDPAAYNSGLMELGQTVCKVSSVACLICPVQKFCAAEDPEALPVKGARRETVEVDEYAAFSERDGAILLEKGSGGRRDGLWKLPEISEGEAEGTAPVLEMKYGITHHRVTLRVFEREGEFEERDVRWFGEGEIGEVAMGAPYRKAVDRLRGRAAE